MYLTDDECTFIFDELLKQSRPSYQEKPLVFPYFPENPKQCQVTTLRQYLNIRSLHSSDTALLLQYHPTREYQVIHLLVGSRRQRKMQV